MSVGDRCELISLRRGGVYSSPTVGMEAQRVFHIQDGLASKILASVNVSTLLFLNSMFCCLHFSYIKLISNSAL